MTAKIQKFLNSLDKKTKEKFKQRLLSLKQSPYEGKDIKKLKGYNNLYRLRMGKIRIIYHLKNQDVEIIDIDHRGNIY